MQPIFLQLLSADSRCLDGMYLLVQNANTTTRAYRNLSESILKAFNGTEILDNSQAIKRFKELREELFKHRDVVGIWRTTASFLKEVSQPLGQHSLGAWAICGTSKSTAGSTWEPFAYGEPTSLPSMPDDAPLHPAQGWVANIGVMGQPGRMSYLWLFESWIAHAEFVQQRTSLGLSIVVADYVAYNRAVPYSYDLCRDALWADEDWEAAMEGAFTGAGKVRCSEFAHLVSAGDSHNV